MSTDNTPRLPFIPLLGKEANRVIQDIGDKSNQNRSTAPSQGTGNGNMTVSPFPNGTVIDYQPTATSHKFKVVIVDEGPYQQEDYDDARYWAREVVIAQDAGATIEDTAKIYMATGSNAFWGTIVNLNEMALGTHSLKTIVATDYENGEPIEDDCQIVEVTAEVTYKKDVTTTDKSNILNIAVPSNATNVVWMKLTNATAIVGHVNAWQYAGEEVYMGIDGYWQTKEDGKTSQRIYNSMEANNSATGVQGSGINVDNLPATFSFKPIGGTGAVGQPVVPCTPMKDCEDPPNDVYVFSAPNTADGTC